MTEAAGPLTCWGCDTPILPPRKKWCSPQCCQRNHYKHLVSTKPTDLKCRHCGKTLGGRQTAWCSMSCKRDRATELALVDGIETYVRKCRDCGLMKPLAVDFYKTPTGTYRRQCRACVMAGNDERNAKPDVADRKRDYHLRGLYGISAAEYEALLVSQGGKCAVCGKPPIRMRLAVDHDHRSGLIRGLLCNHCNLRVIGKSTNAELFRSATEYLANPPAQALLGVRIVPKNKPKKRKSTRRKRAA